MFDPQLRRMFMDDRFDTLRQAASRPPRATMSARVFEDAEIELRLCRAADDDALETLGILAEEPVPAGRLVLALAGGRILAALPLAGGCALRDPFARTAHLIPLLELRARQLRQPATRAPWATRLVRRQA